jgi:hypothetical protein
VVFQYKDKALHRYSKICSLEKVKKSDLKVFQNWLRRKDGGHFFLKGHEARTWSKENEEDLVSMSAKDKDAISTFIDLYIIPFYHKVLGNRIKVSANFCYAPN